MAASLFTSESVTEGHPDKLCDQVADAVLDAIIARDPDCRVACEALTKTGMIVLAGEITTACSVDLVAIARRTICDIGYTDSAVGFDGATCAVLMAIEQQSPDIARGVTRSRPQAQGAGDQGMMFGYACDDTAELMPLPIMLAHKLAKRVAEVRKRRIDGIDWLRPDGKTQASVLYQDGKPQRVTSLVVSCQHAPGIAHRDIEEAVYESVVRPVVPARLLARDCKILVNPTGRFVVGGPLGDSGLTGRKIIVDTYGGMARHGGGSFSGKDPSKVDRSAGYYTRYMAKNVVAAGLAGRCEVQLAYAIGKPRPVSLLVETFGTGLVTDARLSKAVAKVFDPRPGMIIEQLDLRRPIYAATAAYGHFGRSGKGFPWERIDRTAELRAAVGKHGA